jgi:hypothetical protein
MMVLGFVGPLLVLLVTAIFSWRGYSRAVENAERLSREWAVENNQFAADLAAEKVTAEIGRYFEIARDEADRGQFRPLFFNVLESESLDTLADPQTRESDIEPARARFIEEAARRRLDSYLLERLQSYQRVAERDPRAPKFASVFVTDRYGTQIAAAFDDESFGTSIGFNRANRTYFHGGPAEFPALPRPQPNARHIDRTHLSAVFRSRTQGTWKVAISTPIFSEDPEFPDEPAFEGILVLTVALGEFQFTGASLTPSQDRFAVLVDGREGGEDRGTILQHPLFDELLADERVLPEDFFEAEYRVPAPVLSGEQHDYIDPLSQYDGPRDLAAKYQGKWLAAASPVLPPIGAGENSKSGLVVLVQSDYEEVVQPARHLGSQFMRNSFWMLVVMTAVSLGLWYIVVRTFREQSAALSRPVTPVPESTPLHGMTTIAASRRRE